MATGWECPLFRSSSHADEYATPAHGGGPAPEHPGVLALGDGEENHLRAADNILERHVTHSRQHPAVCRVVPIVAHHEEVSGRHRVDVGVVVESVVDAVQRLIADAVRERFLPALDPRGRLGRSARIFPDEVGEALAPYGYIVDVKQPLLHLDAVSGQPDHTLDVIGAVVLWQPKHHDVAARRLGTEDAA